MTNTEEVPPPLAPITEREIFRFREDEEFVFDEEEVKLNEDLSNVLIIDNLPTPDASKMPRLTQLVKRIIERKSPGCNVLSLELATDEKGAGLGFAFVELESTQQVVKAIKDISGFAIEKGRALQCTSVAEMEKYENIDVDSEIDALRKKQEESQKTYKELDDLQWWLRDKMARDMYALRHWSTVEIAWNDPVQGKEPVYKRDRWSEDRINWSPHGSYLVTWHTKGIALWGGPQWKSQSSFPHSNPRLIDFSPRERFIITANEDARDNVIIWDVRTGKRLKNLTVPRDILREQWPLFKWSHDEKYFATLSPQNTGITLFSTTNFKSQHMDIPMIQNFAWSPTTNNIVYWVPDDGTVPAKVVVAELPKLKELRFKNYYDVATISFLWHPDGSYVGVQVDRNLSAKKKQKSQPSTPSEVLFLDETESAASGPPQPDITNIDVFRTSGSKDIAVETLEMREPLTFFSWEPKGDMFATVRGESVSRRDVTIYSLEGDQLKEVVTLKDKSVDRCVWSPQGRFFVLYNSRLSSGTIEFWDSTDLTGPLNTVEHFMMTDLQWDPTGRYVATSVSWYERQQENGYIVWNVLGQMLYKQSVDKLWQFLWRPRAPSLITSKLEKQIKKLLPKKRRQYQEEEKVAREKSQKELLEKRMLLWTDFEEFEKRLQAEFEQDQAEREELFGTSQMDDWVVTKELVEEVVEETEVLDE